MLQSVNQYPGQIDTEARQQNNGQNGDLLIQENQNGKKKNAHRHPEVAGKDIQVDLSKKDDKDTERQNLFFLRCSHGHIIPFVRIPIRISENAAVFKWQTGGIRFQIRHI